MAWKAAQRREPGVIVTFICFFCFPFSFCVPGHWDLMGIQSISNQAPGVTANMLRSLAIPVRAFEGGARALCESGFFLRCCVAKAAPTGPPPQRQVQRPSLVFLRCKRYNREGNREADRSQVEPACQRWIEMECWRDYFMIVIRFGNTANCKMTA
jgi:hypothetical protein